MKQINSSVEFAEFASGKPEERRKSGLQDIMSHIPFLLEHETKVNTSFVQLEALNFAPKKVFNRQRITFTRRI